MQTKKVKVSNDIGRSAASSQNSDDEENARPKPYNRGQQVVNSSKVTTQTRGRKTQPLMWSRIIDIDVDHNDAVEVNQLEKHDILK